MKMSLLKTCLLFVCSCLMCFFTISIQAQISTHEKPTSSDDLSLSGSVIRDLSKFQVIKMPDLDTIALANEDKIKDFKAIPYRFGFSFPVHINLDNAGVWDTLTSETRIWRLSVPDFVLG